MRRRSVVLLAVIFSFVHALSASAQSSNFFFENRRSFYGGFVAGVNISTVDGDTYPGMHKVGFNGGGIVYAQFAPRFGASVSLLYSQKGSRGVKVYDSYYIGTFIEKYYLDLNYAEMALALHFFYNPKFHFTVGGAYGRLINFKEELLTDQPVYFDPLRYPFHSDDISILGGAAYQFGKNLFFDARFQLSVQSIRDRDKIHPLVGLGNRQVNQLLSLRVMYLIK